MPFTTYHTRREYDPKTAYTLQREVIKHTERILSARDVATWTPEQEAAHQHAGFRPCSICGAWFHSKRGDAHLCSPACRMKASRRKRNPDTANNAQEAARKAAQTKAMQIHDLTCAQCGKPMRRDGNAAANTKYCSNACKQKAYRASRKEAGIETPAPTPKPQELPHMPPWGDPAALPYAIGTHVFTNGEIYMMRDLADMHILHNDDYRGKGRIVNALIKLNVIEKHDDGTIDFSNRFFKRWLESSPRSRHWQEW